jgi:thioredoxin-dependent peroxiredoxin
MSIQVGMRLPDVTFRTRVRDDSISGDNPFRWQDMTTEDYFTGKRVILFSLPGAFTPTCSTYQLPGFEAMAKEFEEMGIEDIYCMSVNDSFVMNSWARSQNLENVKVIPDGNGEFNAAIGMLVNKENLGFAARSWRYAMIVNDMVVEELFVEEGKIDNCETDPYDVSSPENIMRKLKDE